MIEKIERFEIEAGDTFPISPCVIAILIDEFCNDNNYRSSHPELDEMNPKDIITFGDPRLKQPGIYFLNKEKVRLMSKWFADTAKDDDWSHLMAVKEGYTPKQQIIEMLDDLCSSSDIIIRLN